ncbi:MAG: RHS repeat-associated core domain-containing protein [Planctomycetaceae bacterium]
MGSSAKPIRYFNGEVVLTEVDVASNAFGIPWEHKRSYSNQLVGGRRDVGNGWNWMCTDWPRVDPSELEGTNNELTRDVTKMAYYGDGGSSVSVTKQRFGGLNEMSETSTTYEVREPDGTLWEYRNFGAGSRVGAFEQVTDPGGNVMQVTSATSTRITEIQKTIVDGSDTFVVSFLYTYNGNDQLTNCLLRKNVNSGSWIDIAQATYTYYNGVEDHGSEGDLKTVTRYVHDGTTWNSLGTAYYRYYVDGETGGFQHGIKFVCSPQAFANLAATVNPDLATDAQVAAVATNKYEYDSNQRVCKEWGYAGGLEIAYTYARNPNYVDTTTTDLNTWIFKTTETQPDGTQTIVYANYAGQTMLYIRKFAGSEWCQFFKYDLRGQVVMYARPSAIKGYDESKDDLLWYQATVEKYTYLEDYTGYIELTEYYSGPASSSSSSGGAYQPPEGYLKYRKIQEGQLNIPVTQEFYEYTAHTEGTVTVYPVLRKTVYPDDSSTTTTIVTSFEYSYHSGTLQVSERTTTLPVVSTTQNGSGTANERKEYFDIYGNLTWAMDERGYITNYTYDPSTGALIQQIDDVDTSVTSGAPTGWTTPADGGLNLITDITVDDLGRPTQTLGPSHQVSLSGTATTVRTASWNIFADSAHTVRTAQGYATGSTSYTYTLVNPVMISQTDLDGRPLANIEATRASTAGKLEPTDTFAQTSYTRWKTFQWTDCCLLASQRVYHIIPETGEGTSGTNYDQTDFGYDLQKRRNRVVTPGGTISKSVFDPRNLVTTQSVGTDDSGGGFDNMVVIATNVYDDDGNRTLQTLNVDGSTTRVTVMGYDFRSRLTTIDGEVDYFEKRYYDNLSRMTQVDRYNTTAAGKLIAQQFTYFDDLSRVYKTVRKEVDPATGNTGNELVTLNWYDESGNLAKSQPSGSDLWSKTSYDGIGRQTVQYVGYGTDTTYADIFNVTGDTILEQAEFDYDDASNVIATTQKQRYHNATQTGALGSPTTIPNARVSYVARYPDAIGRSQATANYGTNGGSAFSRSSTVPTGSDTILVTSQTFDSAGDLFEVTDPSGTVTRFTYDGAGRRTSTIENYVESGSSTTGLCDASEDQNRTTSVTYTPDGNIATLTAENASTGDQVTTYTYGTTLSNANVATSVLLHDVAYPDSVGTSDVVTYSYNRLGQRSKLTDQNGTVHEFNYDGLGRITQDRVTTLAAGIDGTVRRIELAYEVRGMLQRISSSDSATVGSGNIVNEVKFAYNGYGQPITAWQAHAGAVDTMTSPKVQYTYANGSANTVRPKSLVYPSGRELEYEYATGIDDSASRVSTIKESGVSGTHLADYDYLGLGTVAIQSSPEPGIEYTLLGSLTADGDIYTALDRFGRLKQSLWKKSSTALSDVQYGYNRASSRIWRKNPTDSGNHYDWAYLHDGLHRLKQGERGTLSGTSITSKQFAQCWTLDATGNWDGFRQDDNGNGTWDLNQTRTANEVNEITGITDSVGPPWLTPEYDANGNMTAIPTGQAPQGLNWPTFTADEWSAFTPDEWAGFVVGSSLTGTYDAWNRLVKLEDESNTLQENEYDGRGFRVVKKAYSGGTLDQTRHYYFSNSWQVLEERVDASTTPDRHYVWGIRYIDDLILRDRTTTSTLDERLYAMQDGNWNVTTVANASGTVQERYEYDPYGNTTFLSPTFASRSASDYDWETLYAGYRWDSDVGLFQVRFRWYSPVMGTWTKRDSIPQVNRYLYSSSMPVKRLDPLGLQDCGDDPIVDDLKDPFSNDVKDPFEQMLDDLAKQIPGTTLPNEEYSAGPGTLTFRDPRTVPAAEIDKIFQKHAEKFQDSLAGPDVQFFTSALWMPIVGPGPGGEPLDALQFFAGVTLDVFDFGYEFDPAATTEDWIKGISGVGAAAVIVGGLGMGGVIPKFQLPGPKIPLYKSNDGVYTLTSQPSLGTRFPTDKKGTGLFSSSKLQLDIKTDNATYELRLIFEVEQGNNSSFNLNEQGGGIQFEFGRRQ